MNKTSFSIHSFAFLLSLTLMILITVFHFKICAVIELTEHEDLRQYEIIYYVLDRPLFNLQIIILSFDLVYLLIFLLFNCKTCTEYLGFNFKKIPRQKTSDLSNYFIELFFAFLIKGVSLCSSYLHMQNAIEETQRLINNGQTEEKIKLLQSSLDINCFTVWLIVISFVFFLWTYVIKILRIACKRRKTRTKESKEVKASPSSPSTSTIVAESPRYVKFNEN